MNRWLRRGVLVLFWMAIGVIFASIVGFTLGSTDTATIPFTIALIVVTTVVPTVLAIGTATKSGPDSSRSSVRHAGWLGAPPTLTPETPRVLARIESLREQGLTVRNLQHLYEFTVTVLPRAGSPRRAVFSQLITMGQLPNFFTGRYVVLATPAGPEARPMLDPAPDAHWAAELRAAPSRYDEVPSPPASSAPAPSRERSAEGAFNAKSPARRAGGTPVNALIIVVCVVVGFALTALWVFATPQRAAVLIGEAPQRLTGEVHGIWDSAVLDLDLADLRARLYGRSVESVVLFDTYWSIDAQSVTDAAGEDTYAYRNGALTLSWTSERLSSQGGFSITDIDAGVMRRVVAIAHRDDPSIVISDVMIRRLQERLVIDVDSEGVYKTSTRRFDAATGEEIPAG